MGSLIRPARPEDAAALARVNGDTWRAAYRGIFPDSVLEGRGREPDAVEKRRRWLSNPANTAVVAEVDGEVVGFAIAGTPRKGPPGHDCELHAIYVLPEFQGRGLGKRLIAAAAAAMIARGFRAWFLWTLRDNPTSRAFYERLGGRLLVERTEPVEGVPVAEVAYEWGDLGVLAERPAD